VPVPKLLEKSERGQRLDRYELIGEIASGGMATVFLARLAGAGGFQRFFAIKRLHPNLAAEPEFVQMFLDEARLAASIHHPHVVPILEVGTSPAGYYVVMEYIEGDTLARLAARAATGSQLVPPSIALRIVLDALGGLQAAHDLTDHDGQPLGLVHRDVSPQNILVGADGATRLTDFGVARASSRLANTTTGTLKGKLAYMPPEQTQGGAIDRRADVFAMGIVLWEVLAGRRLFKGESEAETLRNLLFRPIPRLAPFAPTLPPEMSDTLERALDREIDRRFASAADFADALERSGLPVASPREVAAYVASVIGQEVQAHRAAVRAWLAESESSQHLATMPKMPISTDGRTSLTVGAMSGPTSSLSVPPPEPRSGVRFFALGAAAALLLAGLAIVLFTRSSSSNAIVAAPPPSSSRAADAPSVSASPPAPPPAASDDVVSIGALPSRPALGKAWPKKDDAKAAPPPQVAPPATPPPPPATPPPPKPADDGYKNPYR
jgi:serine/threonine-protein kinase